jgi:serine/threonine protein kinase
MCALVICQKNKKIKDGHVCISSLGNIRHLAKTAGQAASVVGTRCYFAPERIVGTSFQRFVDYMYCSYFWLPLCLSTVLLCAQVRSGHLLPEVRGYLGAGHRLLRGCHCRLP